MNTVPVKREFPRFIGCQRYPKVTLGGMCQDCVVARVLRQTTLRAKRGGLCIVISLRIIATLWTQVIRRDNEHSCSKRIAGVRCLDHIGTKTVL